MLWTPSTHGDDALDAEHTRSRRFGRQAYTETTLWTPSTHGDDFSPKPYETKYADRQSKAFHSRHRSRPSKHRRLLAFELGRHRNKALSYEAKLVGHYLVGVVPALLAELRLHRLRAARRLSTAHGQVVACSHITINKRTQYMYTQYLYSQ